MVLPTAVRHVNLGVALRLELAVLGAAGYWGFTLPADLAVRVLAGLGAPLALAVLWGVFGSPRASVPLHGLVDVVFKAAWFAAGATALALAGRVLLGIALMAVYAVNTIMLALPRE